MSNEALRESRPRKTPLLEWIASGIGLLLTIAMIGIIGREALSGESEQVATITVTATSFSQAATGYVLAFDASNKTGGAAAAVEIEATLKDGHTIVETGKATLDYVPGYGRASGGVVFTNDPSLRKLEIRAVGFQIP